MKRFIALGAALTGGVIVFGLLPPVRRRLAAAMRQRMLRRMKRMMANLPDDAPPKLIMSVLPQLRGQNEQIIAMLREQNELLREDLRMSREVARRES